MSKQAVDYCVFETESGFCAIGWSDAGILRFRLPASDAAATERGFLRHLPEATPDVPPAAVKAVIDAARRYFSGQTVDFSDVAVRLDGQDDFFVKIYAAVRRLGWGETTTYGTLAKALGAGPEAARDVGQAMAKNPLPLIIPCHRVLAAGGRVGGFSAPGGAQAKQRMLALEGVVLTPPAPAQGTLGF